MSRGRRHAAHTASRRNGSSRLRVERQAMDDRRAERIERRARDAVDDPWACPRPDKRHHPSEALATERCAERNGGQVPHHVDVYACPCGGGWVWGRRPWAEARGEAG